MKVESSGGHGQKAPALVLPELAMVLQVMALGAELQLAAAAVVRWRAWGADRRPCKNNGRQLPLRQAQKCQRQMAAGARGDSWRRRCTGSCTGGRCLGCGQVTPGQAQAQAALDRPGCSPALETPNDQPSPILVFHSLFFLKLQHGSHMAAKEG